MDRLVGSIQHYAWGDPSTLASIQGRAPSGEPEAELWLGAHPVAPSLLAGSGRTLLEAVDNDPDGVLGVAVNERFGRFPYLLKILTAAEPLSIQVHPSLAQARAGFAEEEAEAVAWDSPERTYRDDNHKPEVLCAITPFEAKCGFRPLDDARQLVERLCDAGAASLLPGLGKRLAADADPAACYADALAMLVRLESDEAKALVAETCRAGDVLLRAASSKDLRGPRRSELEWLAELDRVHPGDVGVVVSLLLNHVVLAPGQAIFLRAGNPHAYLRGAGVELMANSDNVIRGGLTVKHVDVDELLAVVDTAPSAAPIQTAGDTEHRFDTPVPEFALTRIEGEAAVAVTPVGPEIVLVTSGSASLQALSGGPELRVGQGEAAFVAESDGRYRITTRADSMVWRATVGQLSLA